MKTLTCVILALFLPALALADTITLTSPEILTLPSAAKLDWRISGIDAQAHRMVVTYRWRDAAGEIIDVGDGGRWNTWECSDTCFTDVFTFQIRAQDVGTPIGVGLRTLIWNRMKQDILTGGNDGSFD